LLKSERRTEVAAEQRGQFFMARGAYLIPLQDFAPESAKRVSRAFENADTLIKFAQDKGVLLFEFPKIAALVETLEKPLDTRN
jgi:hypothetical protein